MARTMLYESNLSKYLWAEVINTACYILNHALIRPILKKTPYELWKGRKSNIGYFHIFDCRYFILNNGKDSLDKFDAKSDEAIFLSYSTSSKTFRVFNKISLVVEESIHVIFNETNDLPSRKREGADDAGIIEDEMKELTLNDSDQQNKVQMDEKYKDENINNQNIQEQPQDIGNLSREWKYVHNHSKELIIGDLT